VNDRVTAQTNEQEPEMLDTLDCPTRTDLLDGVAEDTAMSARTPFSEEQARDFLKRYPHQRPTVRRLALEWGWSKSRVSRFLQNDGTTMGHERDNATVPQEPTTEDRRRLLTNGLADFDKHFPEPTREELVEKILAIGAVAAPKDDDGPTDDDLAVPTQCPIWIYRGAADEVVIKSDETAFMQDDVHIYVRAENARAVAKRIVEVADTILRDREAA
jgi:hypothetical protein